MKKLLIVFLITAILIAGCGPEGESGVEKEKLTKEVEFETVDGWLIKGRLYQNEGESILLLHMLNKDRNDWNEFARILNNEGYNVLAIDMRGHGESLLKDGSEIEWGEFTDFDFIATEKDIDAAQRFLDEDNISIIGASIGANIALNYAASNEKVGALALLSPGEDYHGVGTEDAAREVVQPVFIAASEEDGYAASSSDRLYKLVPGKKELKLYDGAGHGTQMFKSTDLEEALLDWLSENFPAFPLTNATNVSASVAR